MGVAGRKTGTGSNSRRKQFYRGGGTGEDKAIIWKQSLLKNCHWAFVILFVEPVLPHA
jgi:hypothetical protein